MLRKRGASNEGQHYTTKEIGELVGTHITTVIRWIDSGQLRAYRLPGGRRRVEPKDLRDFVARHGLPLKPDQLAALSRAVDANVSATTTPSTDDKQNKRILVVDENKGALLSMARALARGSRYKVTTAPTGCAALLQIGQFVPGVVVIDLHLRSVSALAVIAAIRGWSPSSDVPIVGVGHPLAPWEDEKARATGANVCVPKDKVGTRLVRVVREMLRSAPAS